MSARRGCFASAVASAVVLALGATVGLACDGRLDVGVEDEAALMQRACATTPTFDEPGAGGDERTARAMALLVGRWRRCPGMVVGPKQERLPEAFEALPDGMQYRLDPNGARGERVTIALSWTLRYERLGVSFDPSPMGSPLHYAAFQRSPAVFAIREYSLEGPVVAAYVKLP